MLSLAAALSACGGGGGAAAGGPPGSGAPGGLYVGYYQEDAANNPEDPVPGAFSLNLPSGNGSFAGSMYFTYIGCQSSNVGAVSGTKSDLALSGNWSGTVDGLAQTGGYGGTYSTATGSYSGTYTNANGKQLRDLQPCILYSIAALGTWEMFPVEGRAPATFNVGISGRNLSWSATPGAAFTLVYLLDPVIAQGTGNPVVWQTLVGAVTTVAVPNTVSLVSGKEYIAVVGVSNASHQRAAFGSARFTQP